MSKVSISQSMIDKWEETPCERQFKAVVVDKEVSFPPSDVMRWGHWFETHILGGTANKSDAEGQLTDKEKGSVYAKRAMNHIDRWHEIQRVYGIDNLQTQVKSNAELEREWYDRDQDRDRKVRIPLEGTKDAEGDMLIHGENRPTIIDVKTTASVKNSFGKFSWGDVESMDHKQALHYTLIYWLNHGHWPEFVFIVFDFSPNEGIKIVRPVITKESIQEHVERITNVWLDVYSKLYTDEDEFQHQGDYLTCKACPFFDLCENPTTIPEIEEVEL